MEMFYPSYSPTEYAVTGQPFIMPPTYSPLSVETPSSPESDDSLGLQGLIRHTYAPSIQGELERLFVRPEGPPRARLGSSSSSSDSGDSFVWEEFQANGRTGDLDELDRIMRKQDQERENIEGGRAAEVLSKAKLLEILRIRERERRRGHRLAGGDKNGMVCVFCRNNGESEAIYTSHKLKDAEGHITCPILYIYTCPICGAKGENAHTIKYCPKNDGDASVNIKALKTKRTACGRRRALP